ncbi:acyltransferase [Chishuiella sp.]|uniref:acyltransferase family protein n=1 Tax=Chishuiella sp. TaxID=1969467 RepID=UPI0028AC3370|nr:acyltransferase [Chishuiella sp.]
MNNQNNLNILRLIFASSVIISHSYPLTNNIEIFQKLTNEQVDLGRLSVEIFFIISGYLIFKSLNFSKSIISYLWKRILRLFPALIVMLIFTTIIVIFVNTSKNIFLQNDFYSYIPNNLSLYRVQYNINGVFENNLYSKTINGSLWTLYYEFTMYLIIIPFIVIKSKKWNLIILIIIFLLLSFFHLFKPNFFHGIFKILELNSLEFYRLSLYFIAGSILSLLNLNKIKNNRIIYLLISILILSLYFNIYKFTSIFLLPFIVIIIGLSFNKKTWKFTEKIGDLSYGIYIYGFLIQQTLMNYFNLNHIELSLYSMFFTVILAYLSWHLIEKKALNYKNFI